MIDAEALELFTKPKHFVNFIAQMEAYKTEHERLPHQGIYEDFNISKHFPGLPSMGHWGTLRRKLKLMTSITCMLMHSKLKPI